MKLTAMTYNICSGRNLEEHRDLAYAAEIILKVQPDFVVLNEVRSHSPDVGPINQAHVLGQMTGYFPVFGRSIDLPNGGEYGNAFLSRLPIQEHEVVHIPDPAVRDNGTFEHRSLLRCVVDTGDGLLTVLGTHYGLNPSEHELAVQTTLKQVAREMNPVLLMGDLNLTPDAPLLQPLFRVLKQASPAETPILTFPSDIPDRKIDYILYHGNITVKSLRSMDTQNSDHRPLFAEVTLV